MLTTIIAFLTRRKKHTLVIERAVDKIGEMTEREVDDRMQGLLVLVYDDLRRHGHTPRDLVAGTTKTGITARVTVLVKGRIEADDYLSQLVAQINHDAEQPDASQQIAERRLSA